jgi:hypothetical protein
MINKIITFVVIINGYFKNNMNWIVLALGKLMLVGGRASRKMIQK